jgi:signal transduction histidine kinase
MINKNESSKEFIIKNYLVLLGIITLVMCFVGTVITGYQVESIHKLYINKISSIIGLHKNELLNEIALDDIKSIEEHLTIIENKLSVDGIVLKFKQYEISNKSFELRQNDKFFLNFGPLKVPIANEFANINATLIVYYQNNFLKWIVYPILHTTLLVYFSSFILFVIIFLGLFKKIEKHLILPLKKVTISFKSSEFSNDILEMGNTKCLKEISALKMASLELKESQRKIAFSELAHQVAHDIRSPLTMLNMITSVDSSMSDEHKKLLKAAAARINNIASDLLHEHREKNVTSYNTTNLVLPILKKIIMEKTLTKNNDLITIKLITENNSQTVFTKMNPNELGRILSNIIDNSIEASNGKRVLINVTLSVKENNFSISIRDNAKGIPSHLIGKVGTKGFTFDKIGGNGLGLFHASSTIEKNNGRISIKSALNTGTSITIELPKSDPPSWFQGNIPVNKVRFLIVDDDETVHKRWKQILGNCESTHFYDFNENCLNNCNKNDEPFLLLDDNIQGSTLTGISFIEKYNLSKRSLLVTDDYENSKLQKKCISVGVKIFPKPLLYAND